MRLCLLGLSIVAIGVVSVLILVENARNKKRELVTKERPLELKLVGFNRSNRTIWYECPKCEMPYDNIYFKENKISPNEIIKCEGCGANLLVPKYTTFLNSPDSRHV